MKQKDLTDIVLEKLKKICFPILLILIMLFWQALGVHILSIFKINYNNLSDLLKVIILFILDLGYISLITYIYRKDLSKEIKEFFNKNLFNNLKYAFKYWFIGLSIMLISNYIILIITNGTLATNETDIRSLIDKSPIYMAFQVMLYAPFTEEIIFRKSIRNAINNKYIYILLSGFIFGGLHVITSLDSFIDLIYLIPYCSLGFVFALLYTKTNNIFSTITIHSFHNTLAFLLYLIG